jgi:hypothetical protein
MLQGLAVGGVVLALLGGAATEPLYVETPPPNSKIVIDLVTVNGSGCPKGTTAVAVSPDNTAFTVTFSQYTAKVGKESTSSTDARKNCQLALNVHVPGGFTYAVVGADYRGFAHLEKGSSAIERANYYFQGYSQTTFVQHTLSGPYDDDWQNTDQADIAAVVWSPCGEERYLNVNTELRAQAGSSDTKNTTSYITMDSADGSISTKYHLAWRSCPVTQ